MTTTMRRSRDIAKKRIPIVGELNQPTKPSFPGVVPLMSDTGAGQGSGGLGFGDAVDVGNVDVARKTGVEISDGDNHSRIRVEITFQARWISGDAL